MKRPSDIISNWEAVILGTVLGVVLVATAPAVSYYIREYRDWSNNRIGTVVGLWEEERPRVGTFRPEPFKVVLVHQDDGQMVKHYVHGEVFTQCYIGGAYPP